MMTLLWIPFIIAYLAVGISVIKVVDYLMHRYSSIYSEGLIENDPGPDSMMVLMWPVVLSLCVVCVPLYLVGKLVAK